LIKELKELVAFLSLITIFGKLIKLSTRCFDNKNNNGNKEKININMNIVDIE